MVELNWKKLRWCKKKCLRLENGTCWTRCLVCSCVFARSIYPDVCLRACLRPEISYVFVLSAAFGSYWKECALWHVLYFLRLVLSLCFFFWKWLLMCFPLWICFEEEEEEECLHRWSRLLLGAIHMSVEVYLSPIWSVQVIFTGFVGLFTCKEIGQTTNLWCSDWCLSCYFFRSFKRDDFFWWNLTHHAHFDFLPFLFFGWKCCLVLAHARPAAKCYWKPGQLDLPRLIEEGTDWTHLFPKATVANKDPTVAFQTFQKNLIAMADKCDKYNETASTRAFPECFPMYTQNPRLLECSLSVWGKVHKEHAHFWRSWKANVFERAWSVTQDSKQSNSGELAVALVKCTGFCINFLEYKDMHDRYST